MNEICVSCGLENPAGMRFCGHCGSALTSSQRPDPAGEAAQRRHLTVMFCDLVGSTPLAEALDPEDLRDVILAYQDACARAVERYDGIIAKYIGDGILAYFGYPRAHEDDAQRAVRSGLAILDGVASLNVGLEERFGVALHVRIGMHTGLVVAGEMGGGSTREELAIVGETPNIAARIESIADTDTVAVSGVTLTLIAGLFETRPLVDRILKGVSRDIDVHTIVRATGAQSRLDAASQDDASPIVGRTEELDSLARAWRLAADGRGSVVHISGEAGIGKSRLVRALCETIGGAPFTLRSLQCSPYHTNTALHPVIEHLERETRSAAIGTDTVSTLRATVRRAGLDAPDAVDVLADLLQIAVPGSAAASEPIAPLDERARSLRVLEQMLLGADDGHPVLLVVEDLHWADPTTIDLLGRVVRRAPASPALCVFTFRRDAAPRWAGEAAVLEIRLAPLGAADVSSMVMASGADVDPTVVARVVDAADGVPLFVEEVLKMVRTPGHDTDRSGSIDVPPTLRGLLTERLDRLPHLRDVIHAASVIGRDVSRELLRALDVTADVDAALDTLETSEVLRPVGADRSRYEFAHALLQEAAYDSILRKQRQVLHARVADALVGSSPTLATRSPEVVAHHRLHGGDPASSVPYWRQAGELALQRAAFVEAAGHFRAAVGAIDAVDRAADDHERADLLTHLGASLQAGRGYAAPGVADAYTRARSSCLAVRSDQRLVTVIRGEWLYHMLAADYAVAFDLAGEMLALADRHGTDEHLAEGHLLRGMVEMYRGSLDAARRDLELAIAHYVEPAGGDLIHEAQGDTGVMALAYLAPVLHNLGYVAEALERSDASLDLAERVGGPVTRAQAWGMRTLLLLGRGDREVVGWAERTHAHSAERNITYWRTLSELTLGWLRGRRGDLATGTALMHRALEDYVSSGSRLGLPWFRSLIADLYARSGDHSSALDELARAEAFIAETGEHYSEPRLLLAKARALIDSGGVDPRDAIPVFLDALACARRQSARLVELRAATVLTEHQDDMGEQLTELAALRRLCDWFGDDVATFEVTAARAVLERAGARP